MSGLLRQISEVVLLSDREFQERRSVHVAEQVRTPPQPAPSRHFSNESGVSDGLKRAIQKVRQESFVCKVMKY